MPISANGDNLLHDLARAMTACGHHSTAVALRKLAHAGYTTLEQVDNVSDWVLLSIRGIGVGRLGKVRRLTRPDWQAPSPQAIQTGNWFLSAARFALRYWPPETLTSVVGGSPPAATNGVSVERRLAMDVFSQAACKALSYCPPQELIKILRLASNGHRPGYAQPGPEFHNGTVWQAKVVPTEQEEESGWVKPKEESGRSDAAADSARYAYSPRKRREIVQHYRTSRDSGLIGNKEQWAQSNYNISGRTLLSYEREFPEAEYRTV